MTAEELKAFDTYHGRMSCPHDFDAFWEARMAEADAVEPAFELTSASVPSSASCRCQDLWFYGMREAHLHARVLLPQGEGPHPTVLQFHGYPGATRSWLELASLVGMGFAVVALDCPGQGGLSQDVGGFRGTTVAGHLVAGLEGPAEELYYVRLYQDVRILCNVVRACEVLDDKRVLVNGASQGGGMGIACCALNADLVRGAAILYPFLSDFAAVMELGADLIAYEGLRYQARWLDPTGARQDEWLGKLAYVDTKNFAHLVRCDVLFGTGLADTVCPPQTQCAVYNELTCSKRRLLYAGRGHEEIQEFDDEAIRFLCELGKEVR
ncbi:MAG: alpha/beta fold hydrolase [Coriobacteriales bacterium]|nr:alpha/beta fold hydrolase [Coriobacteriales bacterium]